MNGIYFIDFSINVDNHSINDKYYINDNMNQLNLVKILLIFKERKKKNNNFHLMYNSNYKINIRNTGRN